MNQPDDPTGQSDEATGSLDPRKFHQLRWRIVLFSLLLVLGLSGSAFAIGWQQNRSLDASVQRSLERSHRIEAAADTVRIPLCAILYVALNRTPVGLTQQQLNARKVYVDYYGPGTPDNPGLRCPAKLSNDPG